MTTKLSTIIKNKATDPKDETLKDFENMHKITKSIGMNF